MISTSSFTPLSQYSKQEGESRTAKWEEQETVDALLFPAFRHFRGLVPLSDSREGGSTTMNLQDESRPDLESPMSSIPESIKEFIVENLTPTSGKSKADTAAARSHWTSSPITNPTILVCSHGQRDSRCGILGPVLHDEFKRYLDQRQGDDPDSNVYALDTEYFMSSDEGSPETQQSDKGNRAEDQGRSVDQSTLDSISRSTTYTAVESRLKDVTINMGMISHIGGHKWAGNVIIYFPPGFSTGSTTSESAENLSQHATGAQPLHPLAGSSVWYGRVEPRHVEGIIEQTVVNGKVIQNLFRGGLDLHGKVLRL